MSIVSFRVRLGDRYLHHNFLAVLNDLCSIQARGGSCAGPYGHRLLAITPQRSRDLREEAGRGCEGVKPGWVRVNFTYFISDTVRDYRIDAVDLVASHGYRLDDGPTGLPADFERLRWFSLPPACLRDHRDGNTTTSC